LAANGLLLSGAGAMEQNGAITAWSVQMRFHDLQRKAGGSRGIKGIAAAFQHRHAHLGSDPMGGGHRPKGPADFRARREATRPLLCRKADRGKVGVGHGQGFPSSIGPADAPGPMVFKRNGQKDKADASAKLL
jgi:hypothetical protein